MMTIALIILGIVLLIGGGTALVHGASQIAARLGVSPMIIGLTIVAFGTSMPELVVNIFSASKGATELAFGNIVGSNMANFGLVLGAAALIRPIEIHGQIVRRELPLLMLATAILTVMAMDHQFVGSVPHINRTDGVILLLVFTIFIYITVLDFIRSPDSDTLLSEISSSPLVLTSAKSRYSVLFVIAGIALLYYGGEITVQHSVQFAERMGVSPAIVGLLIVAVGTSMPELVTSIIAVMRGESDLALGNVVGSNLFNTLMVLPAAALIRPVSIPNGGIADLVLTLLFALSLIPVFFLRRARLGRAIGACFLLTYAGWAVFRLAG
ncbi:MAG: calcium/sodium antiporter [Gammaproteobacteria bacterium]|nr:calcium/sodium antiporter [Gammaproteobacteria bacterium]